ncbi:MAG: hypothetical protein U9N85_08390 [Bacteroidota bacterium]|nr:hypothetical protein [Bacteroidota bacterium]
MAKIFTISLFLIVILSACERQNKIEYGEIQYKMSDDVCPLEIDFKLESNNNTEIYVTKYSFPDSIEVSYYYDNKPTYYFHKPGIVHVEAVGDAGNTRVLGSVDIKIPPKPSLIELNGLVFPDDPDLLLEDSVYNARITTFSDSLYQDITYVKTIDLSNYNLGDTLYFDTPVEFPIYDFENNYNQNISFQIYTSENQLLYSWMSSVHNCNMHRYIIFDYRVIHLHNSPNRDIDGLFILADWKP